MQTAGARAYETIRNLLLEGRYSPGARLKEEELTVACGVSRTPVREALKRLAAEGLVIVNPRQGAQVSALAADELEEIYTLRAMFEGYAAARAATRISETALARLEEVQTLLEDALASGQSTFNAVFTPLNVEFHQIIVDAAMSRRLASISGFVTELPLRKRTFSHYSREQIARSMHHHREILAAFHARDPEWAAAAMQSHIRAALQVLLSSR